MRQQAPGRRAIELARAWHQLCVEWSMRRTLSGVHPERLLVKGASRSPNVSGQAFPSESSLRQVDFLSFYNLIQTNHDASALTDCRSPSTPQCLGVFTADGGPHFPERRVRDLPVRE